MRHRKIRGKLGRKSGPRRALLSTSLASLIEHGRISTTLAKAKVLRRAADKAVTLAKKGDLHSRRQAAALIRDRAAVAKLFSEIGPRFADRSGGYTRVLKIAPRLGDRAPSAMIEFTSRGADEPAPSKEKKTKKKKK
jgi:large subunit ribosomal protein L17